MLIDDIAQLIHHYVYVYISVCVCVCTQNFPSCIRTLHVKKSRIFVGDLCESFFYVKFQKKDNQLYVCVYVCVVYVRFACVVYVWEIS